MAETEIDIAAALDRFPLPEGVPDAVLNKAELAQFFGVSLPTIEQWIRAGLPAESDGKKGKAWQIRAAVAFAWKEARDAAERLERSEAQKAIEAMRLKLIGGKTGDSLRGLNPRERREIYAVEAAHEELRRQRNRSIDRDELRDMLEDLFSLFRDAVTSLSDRLERESFLAGEQIEKVNEIGDGALTALEARIADFFDARPIGDEAGDRADLFNQ